MSYKAYLFDLDGTIYRGDEVIPHAPETLAELRKRGALIRFLTNNSSQTQRFFAEKLNRMGIECVPDEVLSSGTGAATYLADNGFKSAFVVGMPGLIETLETKVAVVNRAADGSALPQAQQAETVVVGICLTFTYALLNGAMQQIMNGAKFVATNADSTFPLESGTLSPGAGSLVAAVATCSGVQPFVVGKPNTFLVTEALHEAGLNPPDALVVGDRLDTDIECGRRAGCPTHLVLTGVEKRAPEGQPFSEDLRGLLD